MPSTPIYVRDDAGIRRVREPVTLGLPFPRGLVTDLSELSLLGAAREAKPLQAAATLRWPDGSVKWALLDFQVDLEPNADEQYMLLVGSADNLDPQPGITVEELAARFRIDTGLSEFIVDKVRLFPDAWDGAGDVGTVDPSLSRWLLQDAAGREYIPRITQASLDTLGPLRTTFRLEGVFAQGAATFCQFVARLSFFANSPTVRLVLTVRNPQRAEHPGNVWDLGDQGSIYIRDLAVMMSVPPRGPARVAWSIACDAPFSERLEEDLEIYQDSSGGPCWDSPNHVNRENRVTTSFCGYRTRCGEYRSEGRRAQPLVAVYSGRRGIAASLHEFWQNFPKAIEVRGRTLILRLFPYQYADVHELQGGEQKTHVLFLSGVNESVDLRTLDWARSPIVAHATPEWYASSAAIPYLMPKAADRNRDYLRLVDAAIEGDNSLETKREIADEYGWRHFGDLYADHEATYYTGPPPIISHYNNQYDAVYGSAVQFLRSGDVRWFRIMDQLARHVVDIDVYHTDADRPAYNHGLFWHTSHYVTAGTATHRSYSRRGDSRGGGPCNEHCYTTGLMYHYLMTGDVMSLETAIDLAQWMIDLDDGRKHPLRWLDRGHTGLTSSTASRAYHGAGRGAGNAITALLDGFTLSGERRFLDKAEELIQRCIHPRDDVDALTLGDAEHRWSYTVFLQALGRYLDFKIETDQLDQLYTYARESLLHYARWMADHEVTYLSKPDRLEFPTETWSAQDMRKSDVFNLAARHAAESERTRFLERSDFFFQSSVVELLSMKSRTLTRPVVIMMGNGYMHGYFQTHRDEVAPRGVVGAEFPGRRRFRPQRERAVAKLRVIGVLGLAAMMALAYALWMG